MRWIPLFLILFFTFFGGLNIYQRETRLAQRGFYLTGLVYLTLLEIIVFTLISFDGSAVYIMPLGVGRLNLTRLDINLGFIENIVLTIPLGMMIKWSFNHWSLLRITAIGIVIGGMIETSQYYLSHAFLINRSSDINDVLANASGIVVGAAMVVVFSYLLNKSNIKYAHSWLLKN